MHSNDPFSYQVPEQTPSASGQQPESASSGWAHADMISMTDGEYDRAGWTEALHTDVMNERRQQFENYVREVNPVIDRQQERQRFTEVNTHTRRELIEQTAATLRLRETAADYDDLQDIQEKRTS